MKRGKPTGPLNCGGSNLVLTENGDVSANARDLLDLKPEPTKERERKA